MFFLFLLLVCLAPLPFGAVLDWSWLLLACITGLMLLWRSIGCLRPGGAVGIPFRRTLWFVLPFLLVLGWIGVQGATGLPESWLHPIWQRTALLLGMPVDGTISVDPGASRAGLARFLLYGGVFWLALQWGRDARRARRLVQALVLSGLLYAGYGLFNYFTAGTTILWVAQNRFGSLSSVYINPDHYATLGGLGLLAASALTVMKFEAADQRVAGFLDAVRAGIELAFGYLWLPLLAWVTFVTAVLLTNSRGGNLCMIVGLAVFILGLGLTRRFGFRHALWLMVVAILVSFAFFFSSGGKLAQKLAAEDPWAVRREIYAATVDAIDEQPARGFGLGTFEQVFRTYAPPDIRETYDAAHNSYLENALELGIPACVLLYVALLMLVWRCWKGLRHRNRDEVYPVLGLSATVLVALHSSVDFSLQIPANAITYAAIMGVAVAQSWPTRPHRTA